MGSNCSCRSEIPNQSPIYIALPSKTKMRRNNNEQIILIQSYLHKLFSIKKARALISSLVSELKKQGRYPPSISSSQIASIRWSQLLQIEQDFNSQNGAYRDSIILSQNYNDDSSLHHKLFLYTNNDALIYQSVIYEGQWRYDPKTNTNTPYGRGSITKQTGLKIESFFDDLTPIADISRIYYPNGRIYVGHIEKMSSQYLPHGYGKLYLSTGFFAMNFDNGLPKGEFIFEVYNKEYIAKGVFTDNKIRKEIEIIYANGTNYKGPFNFDNKNFTATNDIEIIKEENVFEKEVLYDFLSFYDLIIMQKIPNRIIQEKIKKRSMNLKQNHYMTNNEHMIKILNCLHCKLAKPNDVIKEINAKRFISISAYETNGGILDHLTHFSNIFIPSSTKVFFSNFLYDHTRITSNVYIKGILNHSINKELAQHDLYENEDAIIKEYDLFMSNYTLDYYKTVLYHENIVKKCCTTGKTDYLFSINQVIIDINIHPSLHVLLTNPVKCFAVFITHESFVERQLDEFAKKDKDKEIIDERWRKYIDVEEGNEVCPVNICEDDDFYMVEFDSSNKLGLFLFVEMKEYKNKIIYDCQKKLRHIGKEIIIMLYDQNITFAKSAKCGIDFGTIIFNGNVIEIQSI